MNSFKNLYFTTIDLRLKVTEKIILPPGIQKGYLFRQSLGNALHKTLDDYALGKIWSNTLSEEQHKLLKISREPPRGYIIEPPDTGKMVFNINDFIESRIILIGYVTDYISSFIDAFEFLGTTSGLGIASANGCGKFKLDQILINGKKKTAKSVHREFPGKSVQKKTGTLMLHIINKDIGEQVKLNFITPAEIKIGNNKRRLLLTGKQDVPYFFVTLYKRLTALESIYCTGVFDSVDYDEVFESAKTIDINTGALERLRIKIAGKYLHGFRGEIVFSGELTAFQPSLILGEFLHIGSETVYGLGKYEIVV